MPPRGFALGDAVLRICKEASTRVFDLKVALDDLSRVLDADEGQLTAGSIATRARRQQWTLTQAGNWSNVKVDLDGDGAYTAAGEMNDTETFNAANEILTRDTDTKAPSTSRWPTTSPAIYAAVLRRPGLTLATRQAR